MTNSDNQIDLEKKNMDLNEHERLSNIRFEHKIKYMYIAVIIHCMLTCFCYLYVCSFGNRNLWQLINGTGVIRPKVCSYSERITTMLWPVDFQNIENLHYMLSV